MKLRRNKKGFTIIELVIVIAVIGILAAVLIPTFVNLTNKANEAADNALVNNLNKALKMEEQEPGHQKAPTLEGAIKDLEDQGYILENLASKSGKDLLWSQSQNQFLLNTEGKSGKDYWKIVDAVPENLDNQKYSYYAGKNFSQTDVTVKYGFDAGRNYDIAEITYEGTGTAQEVAIRTNSFSTILNILAPSDIVNHIGNAARVNVDDVDDESYHENGTVGRLIVKKGHAVAENNAVIFCFINAGEGETATAEVKGGAVVYDDEGQPRGQEAVVIGAHDDCGPGNHDFGSQLVIDNKVYEVCKSCGYTLVRVVDFAGVETLTTMVDEDGEIVNTPTETYNTTATDSEGNVIQGKEEPVVESPKVTDIENPSCLHEFVNEVTIEATCQQPGLKTFTCIKCGSSYTSAIHQLAHKYYDVVGHEHTSDETCEMCGHIRGSDVAEINGTKYTTLTDAIAAVPADGTQTTIKLVNDDAIRGNAGWIINQNQNIILDLNGYTLKNLVTQAVASSVIDNKGTLTIIDSSDLNHDGTGTGKIFVQSAAEYTGLWPVSNWATNAILNDGGVVNIYSGIIECDINGGLGYCIDSSSNSRSAELNIYGGRLIGGNADQAIRLHFNGKSLNNVFNMSGGVIESGGFWLYHNAGHYTGTCTVNIIGGEINGFIDFKDNGDTSVNISGGEWNITKIRLRDSDTNATANYIHISAGILDVTDDFVVDDQRTSGDGGIEILEGSTAIVSDLIPLGPKN